MTTPLIEAIARAMRNFVESQPGAARELTATTFIHNRDDRLAQAALTAITEAGYVVCPREPTKGMVEAGNNALSDNGVVAILDDDALVAYRAMIAASDNGPVNA